MLGLLKDFVLSASANSACSSAAACSPKTLNWIAFNAMVCPLSGSLALYTAPVGDFASSLWISKWPIFVGIIFASSTHPGPFASPQQGSTGANPGDWLGLGYRCTCEASSYQSKPISSGTDAVNPITGVRDFTR